MSTRIRILAADDDRITRRLLAVNLERWGYDPVMAADGQEVWEMLQGEDAPEVIVLDWVMPGLDGIEVCRALRRQTDRPYRYVILLAPTAQKSDVIAAFEAGADDYLTKPINLHDLEDRITSALRGLEARKRYGIAATRAGEGFDPVGEVTKVEPESPTQATLAGKVIGGKYKVLRPIASGGMGSVWEAFHTTLETRVAIKFIKPEYARDNDSMTRFETEARVMARLNSRHATHVYDYGVTPGGLPYLVMEFLEGRSLTEVIEKNGALPAYEVASIISQAANALEKAHRLGIIHRDLKPDNIMLVADDEAAADDAASWNVKLVDFGVAKVLLEPAVSLADDAPNPSSLRRPTGRGVLLGTPAFMSPEQLLASGVADKHADLWGLAVCTFVAMTGKLPYEATSLGDLIKQVCLNPPPVPSQVNPELSPSFDAWFARACASNVSDRFQSGFELARELQNACGIMRPSMLSTFPTPLPGLYGEPTPARGVPALTSQSAQSITRISEPKSRSGFVPGPPRAPTSSPVPSNAPAHMSATPPREGLRALEPPPWVRAEPAITPGATAAPKSLRPAPRSQTAMRFALMMALCVLAFVLGTQLRS